MLFVFKSFFPSGFQRVYIYLRQNKSINKYCKECCTAKGLM